MTKFHSLLATAFCCLVLMPLMPVPRAADAEGLPQYVLELYGAPPSYREEAPSSEVEDAVDLAVVRGVTQGDWGDAQVAALEVVVQSGDPRLAWILGDAIRYAWDRERYHAMSDAAAALLGIEFRELDRWTELTNTLMAWEIPAYPGYLAHKRAIFTHFGKGWEALFVPGDIDWRLVSWGGVEIDNRPFGDTNTSCPCIPAIDLPEVSAAQGAGWLADDAVVFGIVVNGEARAYPRRIMEVREMVNDRLGGRSLGIPYCTLCGTAQAYFTDEIPEELEVPVLRTSGLLIRSNKVMFDLNTYSVFDTFRGRAVTGPMADLEVVLEGVPVVTTNWASWRAAHPDTTVLVEADALGRDYDFRNGRDKDGPIFPIGAVDPRLAVQEDVIGVVLERGAPIAFPKTAALAALKAGQTVSMDEVRIVLAAGGLQAVNASERPLTSHEAYWFAWSQFHPTTRVWGR